LRTTITSVHELDVEFLSHRPKPLFPGVQKSNGAIIPPPGHLFWVDDNDSQFVDDTGALFVFTLP